MILVDTSVWIDHLHRSDDDLGAALHAAQVVRHPAVVGELALGSIATRSEFLEALDGLPCVRIADDREVRGLVGAHRLWGRGLGWTDVNVLASTLVTPGCRLWTRDKRLRLAAIELGVDRES
jgi:predicted nucleic acid-binding protein